MKLKNIPYYLSYIFLLAVAASAFFPYFSFLKSGTVPCGQALLSPSPEHWFGTDDLGIDIFASICYGSRTSLLLSIGSAFFAVIGGSLLGMLAGYAGGIADTVILSVIDFFIGIPDLLLMVVLGAFIGQGLGNIIFAISAVSWVMPAKIMRSEILKIKKENYIKLSKAYGANFPHLFLWHFWKPLFSVMLVSVIKIMNKAILAEASLAYLGLGDPLSKSWGMTITRAMAFPNIYLTDFWKWWLVFPTIITVFTVLSVALIGKTIEQKIGTVYKNNA
ncbi:ABC transporter permease [Treponema pedis]|uniref:ABC transporter permease n=1 Tax=Treponema pedis TaxID=409322 RepID=UPI0003FB4B4F|nr:ABC transporter permease [Treponema pedis]